MRGLLGRCVKKKRNEKENRRKSNERKRNWFENSTRLSYLLPNPLANELPHCLIYPPFLTIPQACISVEDVATILFRRDAPFVAHLLKKYIYIGNAAGSRVLTNLEANGRDKVYCILHPVHYQAKDTNGEDKEDDKEGEENYENEEESIEEEDA